MVFLPGFSLACPMLILFSSFGNRSKWPFFTKSEGLSLYQSICLWLSSVLESERLSRSMPRLCVTYDHLLDHPASVMQSCIELFDGKRSSGHHQFFETSATNFVRPDFRRQRSESLRQLVSKDGPLYDLLSFADSVYRIFEQFSLNDSQEYSDCLDRYYDQWRLFATTLEVVDNKLIIGVNLPTIR